MNATPYTLSAKTRRKAQRGKAATQGFRRGFGVKSIALACLAVALAWFPQLASASPSSALREYKAGRYDEALKDYEKLLRRRSDDPRLHFNAGTAAYRNRQLDEATKQFDAALSTPDLKLQELAYYNRGNTRYWLGELNPDPKKKIESWETALKDFENSLKLNPQDADARYNHEFVKRRLGELKQQQQQQDQSKQDKSDKNQKQDQQQQQQQKQQEQQSKQEQNQQQESQQNQSQQKQDASQQQSQKAEEEKQQQQASAKPQDQKQQEQQASQAPDKEKEKSGEEEQQAAAYAAGQMTPEQARQLLDAQKGEEQMLQLKPEGKPLERTRPFKDW